MVVAMLLPTSDADAALKSLRTLTVLPEHRCSPYDRNDYRRTPSVEQEVVNRMGGRVYSPYSGRYFPAQEDTDIEHIVATSQAHDSGLCNATAALRSAFANDPDNLTLASPEVNRYQKSDKDAREWLPPMVENRCWFAARVVLVRDKYNLTVDPEERDTLEAILKNCKSTSMVFRPVLAATEVIR